MEVELTKYELMMGAYVGISRQASSLARKLRSKMPVDNPWQIHVEGALGEVAVAKALNLYWDGSVDTWKAPDIGDHIQVRCRSKEGDALIVRDGDSDTEVFILVTGQAPKYTVRGWLTGAEAKQEKWISNPGGRGAAFFVPQSELRPLSELPKP
jgi:hypothetical protein